MKVGVTYVGKIENISQLNDTWIKSLHCVYSYSYQCASVDIRMVVFGGNAYNGRLYLVITTQVTQYSKYLYNRILPLEILFQPLLWKHMQLLLYR